MHVKKIILNTIWFGIVPKLSAVISVFIMPLITPFLTAADYGIAGTVSSYASVFLSIYALGMNVHLTNSYYENNDFHVIWGRILFILIISGIVCACILAFFLFFALPALPIGSLFIVIALATSPLIFGSNSVLASHLYPLRYDPKSLVLPILFSNIIGVLVQFYLIRYMKLGYFGLLANGAIASLLTFSLFLKPLWIQEKIIPVFDMDLKQFWKMLKISLPVIPHTLGFVFLSSSSIIIMNIYNIPLNEIGYYTNGYYMGAIINIATGALISALAPRIQELYRSNEFLKLGKVYLLSQIFAMIVIFLFAIWMPEIYKTLVKNDDLQQCSQIASLICFSNITIPLYTILSTSAFIEKETIKLLWLVFVPGILNIVLNLMFMPMFGYKTAIFASLISYWSLLLIPVLVKYYSNLFNKLFSTNFVLIVLFTLFVILTISSNYISIYGIMNKIFITLFFFIIIGSSVYKFKSTVFDF